jgi:hypothetical protein
MNQLLLWDQQQEKIQDRSFGQEQDWMIQGLLRLLQEVFWLLWFGQLEWDSEISWWKERAGWELDLISREKVLIDRLCGWTFSGVQEEGCLGSR